MSELQTEKRRFRKEGRSSSGTYERLFSEKYNAPPKKAEWKLSENEEVKKLLSVGRRLAQPGIVVKTIGKVREKIPQPLKNGWKKVKTAVKAIIGKLRSWKHLTTVIKGISACAVMGLCVFNLFYSIGSSALERSGVFDIVCENQSVFSQFSPKGSPVQPDPDMQSGGVLAVSSGDIPSLLKKDTGSRTKAAFLAGADQLSALGLDLTLYYKAEAGVNYLSPLVFSKNGNRDIEYVIPPTRAQLDTVGCHTLRVRTGGRECNVLLVVEDTAVPQVELKNIEVMLGDEVTADMFVEYSSDPSKLLVSYSHGAPNLNLSGQQLVYLSIMDISGNACELLAARLTVMADVEPPVISGAEDRTVVLGETVSYKEGVTVTDALDDKVTLNVDTSAVDPTKEGYYEVIYTASDSSGNESSVTVTFHFAKLEDINTDAEFDKYVGRISSKIFRSGMTDAEKLWEIYEWCRNNISYSGRSDKDDWRRAAVSGFRSRSGDCFTYFACAKALIEYCGIENIDVYKIKDTTDQSSHFWSLVDIGTGYYHFDATPRKGGFDGFMLTDKQLQDYSLNNSGSHRYHTNLYPSTPAEKFTPPAEEKENTEE